MILLVTIISLVAQVTAALAFTTKCKGCVGAHRKNMFKIIENDLLRTSFNF